MKEYQAYLFDMDGTLVNSEPLKGMALASACGDYGSKVDFNIYKAVMGESWQVVTGHFYENANIKPDPEAYHLAINQLSLQSENVLVFEDSTAGVKAGVDSGCDVIAVKHAFNKMNDLSLSKRSICSFGEMFI